MIMEYSLLFPKVEKIDQEMRELYSKISGSIFMEHRVYAADCGQGFCMIQQILSNTELHSVCWWKWTAIYHLHAATLTDKITPRQSESDDELPKDELSL